MIQGISFATNPVPIDAACRVGWIERERACYTVSMKLLWLSAVLAFAALSSAVFAASACIEITPETPHFASLGLSSRRLVNGDIEFTVTLSSSFSGGTSVGVVRTTGHSESSRSLRRVPAVEIEGALKCVFSVTQKELEDPDLCFRFTHGDFGTVMTRFIPLKKFLPL